MAGFCVLLIGALLASGVYQGRLASRANLCSARQFRIALATQAFSNEFQQLPGYRELQAIDAQDQPLACSWVFPILPFIEPLENRLRVKQGDQIREIRGDKLPPLSEGEQIVFNASTFQEVFDRFGPGGPVATRGRIPQQRIKELICPAAYASDSAINVMSWRVNTGLPDQTDKRWPADWPANGVFLDHFLPHGPTAELTLSDIENQDGLSYTVLFSEGLQPQQWTDTGESEVGMVWARQTAAPAAGAGEQVAADATTSVDPADWRLSGVAVDIRTDRVEADDTGSAYWGQARPGSSHSKGINVAFCSGATTTISRDIDAIVWAQMMMSHDSDARFPGTQVSIPVALGGAVPEDEVDRAPPENR